MKKINIVENQNIIDIAVQEYGNRLAVFQILSDNPKLSNAAGGTFSLEKDLANQTILIREAGDLINKQVLRSINNKVTSYFAASISGGEAEGYLSDENLIFITTDTGEPIFLNL